MCHGSFGADAWLRAEIAEELLEAEGEPSEDPDEAVEAAGTPSFLNEEREADVELLTDGGGE